MLLATGIYYIIIEVQWTKQQKFGILKQGKKLQH